MSKTLNSNQAAKLSRTYLDPRYFAHIYLAGETLYLSNRTFKYNGHQYEALLLDLPALTQSIEQLGGYQNVSCPLTFRNVRYRNSAALIDWLNSNPITRREMDLFELYVDPGEVFGADVSTKLARLAIGELQGATDTSISYSLSSIMHYLDSKSPFVQINRTNWPDAAPAAIGKYENLIYGSVRDVPCHCVLTGAVSTLFLGLAVSGETYIILSEVDWPIAFPSSGTVQIDDEKITYSAKDSTNKRLTISARAVSGTTAAIHSRGAPVWLVISAYKYLPAGQISKSAANVKTANIRLDPATYTINLNDGGKTTIAFTAPQMLKIQGMHSHLATLPMMTFYGSSGSLSNSGSGWTTTGVEGNMHDQNMDTNVYAHNDAGPWGYGYWYQFRVNFTPAEGTIFKTTLCIKHNSRAWNTQGGNTMSCIAYYDGGSETVALNNNGTDLIQKFELTTKKPITHMIYTMTNNSVSVPVGAYIFEMWLEIYFTGVGASAAEGVYSAPTDVIAPQITCDVEGFQDDGSGTYTGTPNALIEVPSDQRKHLLIARYGRSSGEIGASFATARTAYVNRISGGYKFGMILNQIGMKASEIFKRLDEQSRSNMREDGGLFELTFNDAADPASALTIDKKIYVGKPVFKQTRMEDIKNAIQAVYDIDWSGAEEGKKFGNYRRQTRRINSASITKYGELPLDIEFPAVQIPAMADDVADWQLLQQKDTIWCVDLVANRKARILEKGDYFILNDVFASLTGQKWRVLNIQEVPYSQNFNIQAIQYVAP